MRIQKDLKELQEAGLISSETAEGIKDYYKQKEGHSQNRLFAIFGVLGAALIGMGIILIIAHNWDDLSKTLKTFFAFMPLILGQCIAAYTLWKQDESTAWREGSAAFIFFALGACISLVSQIYNISGNLGGYLLTWMLLALPMIYVLRSSVVALFYLAAITYYGCELGYFNSRLYDGINWYWLLLVAVLPHYYLVFRKNASSNFLTFFNWMLPLSLTICLGIEADHNEEWMFLAYMSLFGILYLVGRTKFLQNRPIGVNGFEVVGVLGSLFILLMTSFRTFWTEFQSDSFQLNNPEFYMFIGLVVIGCALLTIVLSQNSCKHTMPYGFVFLIFIPIFFLGLATNLVVILVNILLLFLAIWTIKRGADESHLGLLNFGLLIIVVLVSCRFFDSNLSFVLRGLLFVALGLGFFLTNYWMIKKLKKDED